MYPIRFKPIYRDAVWGGFRIAEFRSLEKQRIAESWEISDRKEGTSVVINGPFKGKTLHDLVLEMKEDLLGEGQHFDKFPLLIKIIDAKENLSVQVHPDEEVAAKFDDEAKSEAWFSLSEGSIYAGLEEDVNLQDFKKGLKKNRVEPLLNKLSLKAGDVIDLPAGRVHAICGGSLLYEIQQNSDTTYRLFDWGRDRELHLEKGLEAIRFDLSKRIVAEPRHLSSDLHHQVLALLSSPYFVLEKVDIFDSYRLSCTPKSFQIFFCVRGEGVIRVDEHEEELVEKSSYLVPAKAKSLEIKGKCELLRVRLGVR